MANDQEKINQLLEKLDLLLKKQEDFSREIDHLRGEIGQLKSKGNEALIQEATKQFIAESNLETKAEEKPEAVKKQESPVNRPPTGKSDIEKFIGENLINKIGIAITIIGVAIGAKYAIDHQLISPLTRIILGYLVGIGLLGFAIRLKRKYENFSAVLLSGAMAIMYFITFAAYSFYNLIPQIPAFGIMVLFTAFTVVAAINYNRHVIALIGLVGAYAVPFLLSEDSGNSAILFSYMAIINGGILVIAFKKYWKSLYYSAFGLTWLIFFAWSVTEYQTSEHFAIALTFSSVFFGIFYLTFLGYKLLQKEEFERLDILLLLTNSFVYYGLGYNFLSNHETGLQLVGLFTLANALIHFVVSTIIYRQKLADRNLFYLVSGLVLVFITIAIPVQLDGNWVTLLWVGEATLMFWIGRTKKVGIYELISYPLMLLAFLSLVQDWTTVYDRYYFDEIESQFRLFLNVHFLTSVLFIGAFGFINFLNQSTRYDTAVPANKRLSNIVFFSIPAILIITIYYAFRLEIANYWNQLYANSEVMTDSGSFLNEDLMKYKIIWIIDYSMLFVSLLAWVNFKKIKNQQLGLITFGLITLMLAVFLIQGLFVLSELRESYSDQHLSEYYNRGIFNLVIRYVSFVFVALTLVTSYKYIKLEFMQRDFALTFDFLLHITILWILSSELIHWLDIAEFTQSYKLGLSILWGSYALILIVLGIWKLKKHLRIGAISLFGVTLIKLFFYDISHLDTIAKTIVFVLLGVLLLIISFLYNKYKHVISDEGDR